MILRLLKLLISVTLIAVAINLLNWETMVATAINGSVWHLFFAVALNIFGFLIMAARWFILVAPLSPKPFLTHLTIYLRATFLNFFTPANLGGDLYRLMKLNSPLLSKAELFKLLLQERLIGLYGCLLVFGLAWLSLYITTHPTPPTPYDWGLAFVLAAFVAPIVAAISGAFVIRKLRYFFRSKKFFRLERWIFICANLLSVKSSLKLLALSVVGMLIWVESIKLITDGVGLSIPFVHIAAAATLVEVIRIVPLTVQGIGVREGSFAYLLMILGHDTGETYAAGAIAYLALSISIILAGPLGILIEQICRYFFPRFKS